MKWLPQANFFEIRTEEIEKILTPFLGEPPPPTPLSHTPGGGWKLTGVTPVENDKINFHRGSPERIKSHRGELFLYIFINLMQLKRQH